MQRQEWSNRLRSFRKRFYATSIFGGKWEKHFSLNLWNGQMECPPVVDQLLKLAASQTSALKWTDGKLSGGGSTPQIGSFPYFRRCGLPCFSYAQKWITPKRQDMCSVSSNWNVRLGWIRTHKQRKNIQTLEKLSALIEFVMPIYNTY